MEREKAEKLRREKEEKVERERKLQDEKAERERKLREEKRRQERIEEVRKQIASLETQIAETKGLFAGVKRNKIQKEIDILKERLKKM